MKPFTLLANPSPDQKSWIFDNVPREYLSAKKPGFGKMIRFTADAITIESQKLSSNRILQNDDLDKFILATFFDLRFRESGPAITAAYIKELFLKGLFLNGIQYRFYHHGNSQLRGRSCYLRQANTDEELDKRIYALGDFEKIMNIAKRAKRISLLFSETTSDFELDQKLTRDIPDIIHDDENFSDGCGLMSKSLAIQVSRARKIIFRNQRYTPAVFQIRYRGYKGVLMLHPSLKDKYAEFRHSMKKFSITPNDTTFSVVGNSEPYQFGRLNNDIIVLLSSLGVTNQKLLNKQREYFSWINEASTDPIKAIDFLACLGEHAIAEKVLLRGLDDPTVADKVRGLQNREVNSFRKNDKLRTRMIIRKSRLLYGVCDPFGVLKEGQVHIRVLMGKQGVTTPIYGDVLVVRNPCLHPGDCLKLRAVHKPELSHLIDCIVFATIARPGNHSAPAMSSGGDLDGDKFFVSWDADIVPPIDAESYDYPPGKEYKSSKITRADLANHFASYNSSGLAKVAMLHQKWARFSPKGALCSECQELNALHSQSVDGKRIKIPARLTSPPEGSEPYILDLLADDASNFCYQFTSREASNGGLVANNADEAEQMILNLLQSPQNAMSEYELFNVALSLARSFKIDIGRHLGQINVGALSAAEKYRISAVLRLDSDQEAGLWNSLLRSDILDSSSLTRKNFLRGMPAEQTFARAMPISLPLQRLYSSEVQGTPTFFRYLGRAMTEHTRKILVLKTDTRFSIGIFISGIGQYDEEVDCSNKAVVCSFLDESHFKHCPKGFMLQFTKRTFQLYNKQIADTFVFITKLEGLAGIGMSVALQKISETVRKQIGKIQREPVTTIELHVVSNRDRVGCQLFDMYFEHVPTEQYIGRFDRDVPTHRLNAISGVDWSNHPSWLRDFFPPNAKSLSLAAKRSHLADLTIQDLKALAEFCFIFHEDELLHLTFDAIIQSESCSLSDISYWLRKTPILVYVLLRTRRADTSSESCSPLLLIVVQSIIRSANEAQIAALIALQDLGPALSQIPSIEYSDLMRMTAMSIRSQNLVQEALLTLHENRIEHCDDSDSLQYFHKNVLAVAFDHAEEAANECPCDNYGKPRAKVQAIPIERLKSEDQESNLVTADIRVDSNATIRLHSHVRLQASSDPLNSAVIRPILDGVVEKAMSGQISIKLFHPTPPEVDHMAWNLYNCGSVATADAMLGALSRLLTEASECCGFHDVITRRSANEETVDDHTEQAEDESIGLERMNLSQRQAVKACDNPLSLIWGPPGTGKTTVVVQILRRLLSGITEESDKILVTASTHNAVDNVLERFVDSNRKEPMLSEDQILRVATDQGKVNKSLQQFTIDARVGGDMNENNRLFKQAKKRVEAAMIIFTTCAGAGLGILRQMDFGTVIIDESTQITEPCALIPLVKACRRAVLVGDHVQLRPSVGNMGKVLQYDVSLLERLYTRGGSGMKRTMLNIQYRFTKELAAFPSQEFYEGNLDTHDHDSSRILRALEGVSFPWPRSPSGGIMPVTFLQCNAPEDMGGQSKGNEGQIDLIQRLLPMLLPSKNALAPTEPQKAPLTVTVLTPYTKQLKMLKSRVAPTPCFTIDSFQGRESDVIVFSTVRCNNEEDIGFLDDARRLNVMWTRAKLALIIVGDRKTLQSNALWKRAVEACKEVTLPDDNPLG